MSRIIGIIGSGIMGSGIASVSALRGFNTVVFDLSDEILEKARSNISKGFGKLAGKGLLDESKKPLAEERLEYVTDLNSLSRCNFIIEAAAEDLSVKRKIFTQLEKLSDAILATNTSSLSITSIAQAVSRNPERVVGMHFFNPANAMKLIEIVKGERTSDETIKQTAELCRALGKVPVFCKDTPAFIVNRVARHFYLEALRMLDDSEIDVAVIDKVMKEEGRFKMGPFELMDLIGIDVNYAVTKSVYEALSFNSKYEPHPIQKKMIEAGTLGKKTGRGFYNYT